MSKIRGSVAAEARLRWITDRLAADGAVTLADAASHLGVSEMTIRRDLDELEGRGAARRVRGGATAVGPEPFSRRTAVAARAKSRIAEKLVDIVPTHGAIAVDASSTVLRLAAALDRSHDLTVITNGLETFSALQQVPGVTPLLTGGWLDPRTGSLVGPIACRAAAQLSVDVFVASAASLDPDTGAFEATLEEAEVKRTVAGTARRVVLAADASKLGARGVALGMDWDRVDLLVTDLASDDPRLDPYRAVVEVR